MKKAKLKAYILYDLIHVTFSKRQNCSDTEQSSDCQGLEMGRSFCLQGSSKRILGGC